MKLDKVTLDYSPGEDRLLARAQADDGARIAFWLTQRLARRLVQALREHLERTEVDSPVDREVVMQFRQEQALAQRTESAPVPAVDVDDAFLLHVIDVHLFREGVTLAFGLPGGERAGMTLSQNHVWQYLHVLLAMFRKADWPQDVWPDWMREEELAASARGAGTRQVVH